MSTSADFGRLIEGCVTLEQLTAAAIKRSVYDKAVLTSIALTCATLDKTARVLHERTELPRTAEVEAELEATFRGLSGALAAVGRMFKLCTEIINFRQSGVCADLYDSLFRSKALLNVLSACNIVNGLNEAPEPGVMKACAAVVCFVFEMHQQGSEAEKELQLEADAVRAAEAARKVEAEVARKAEKKPLLLKDSKAGDKGGDAGGASTSTSKKGGKKGGGKGGDKEVSTAIVVKQQQQEQPSDNAPTLSASVKASFEEWKAVWVTQGHHAYMQDEWLEGLVEFAHATALWWGHLRGRDTWDNFIQENLGWVQVCACLCGECIHYMRLESAKGTESTKRLVMSGLSDCVLVIVGVEALMESAANRAGGGTRGPPGGTWINKAKPLNTLSFLANLGTQATRKSANSCQNLAFSCPGRGFINSRIRSSMCVWVL
ncbi:hypothetical protein FOA52_012694 [Chlamydomonas sp. UWO 241]|nr:hypothetical protein FOA52_012694 [Chlamydomonas sp. UWO 241]